MRKKMKLRWIGFTFIVICMLIGLLAGFFSHSIEAALTVPLNIRASQATSTSSKMGPGSPVGTAKPSMPSTPAAGGVTILAQDTFKRANQVFWGKASDGRQWASDANSIEVFSVVSGAGQIDHAQGTFNAVLGPVNTNAEVVFSGIVNQFAQGGIVNMGAVLRWTDANNWYKALIDGSKLQILRRVNGKTTSLSSVPFSAQGGTSYTLRFRVVGAALFVKAWQSNQPEPNGWMLTVMDTMLSKGLGGLRFLMQSGVVIKVSSFRETTVAEMI
jgi:hypothetical protein